MRTTILLAMIALVPLYGADERKVALETAAGADFARVEAAASPDLAAATKCVQSEAMLAAIATTDETPAITFRKGFCQLAVASATGDPAAYEKAAETFDDAIADAQSAAAKQKIPAKVPDTWRILTAVAHVKGGATPESQLSSLDLAATSASSPCEANSAEFCYRARQIGDAWLGWMALNRNEVTSARQDFAEARAEAWSAWTAGREAFERGDFPSAASEYGRAIQAWRSAQHPTLEQQLEPQPVMSEALTDQAGAQIGAGDVSAALTNLAAAIKADSGNARAYYLRGVAKRRQGQGDAANSDFDLASRAALAKPGPSASAEAHFYRGIVFYQRKEFVRAEDEFQSALNADVPSPWRTDARAWRFLAAVAGGACGASRDNLGRAMGTATPYFPKSEAAAAVSLCRSTSAEAPRR